MADFVDRQLVLGGLAGAFFGLAMTFLFIGVFMVVAG